MFERLQINRRRVAETLQANDRDVFFESLPRLTIGHRQHGKTHIIDQFN